MNDVRAEIGYSERTEQKPYFYANAHEKDFVPLKPAEVAIADARGLGCTLERIGDSDLCRLERHEVLLVRIGVEIGFLFGPLRIADRCAYLTHAGSNSSVSIVGRIASW